MEYYIGNDSWAFFKILNINSSFLKQSAKTWKSNQAYKNVKLTIDSIRVVNEAAKRGVKLAQNFNEASQKQDGCQNVLLVVEIPRKFLPKQRTRNTNESLWHLVF